MQSGVRPHMGWPGFLTDRHCCLIRRRPLLPVGASSQQRRSYYNAVRQSLGSPRCECCRSGRQPSSEASCNAEETPDEPCRPRGPPAEDLCEPSTSGSDNWETRWRSGDRTATAMLAAPLAAASLEKLKGLQQQLGKAKQAVEERIFYERLVPPVGMETISYARFMELMFNMKVKRIIVLGEGTAAIVEVPAPGFESDQTSGVMDRFDDFIMYGNENPEWSMEKIRYYVELPGDFWDDGTFMQLLKENMNPQKGEDGRIQYDVMRKFDQVHPELAVLDPGEALPFMGEYASFFQPMLGLVLLQLGLVAAQWVYKNVLKRKKDPKQELMEQYGAHKALMYNIGQSSKDTGVRYKDVAGIDNVKADIAEVMKMVLGDQSYRQMGARPPRGILLEGPPGTGKTYLAKAMAGDSGLPFYSAVGSEFVEMFQGVAAARVRDLFKAARATAPSIIFIDEIDALGRARSAQADSGSQEREQGLLQLLYEMDGIKIDDRVLVIGATNRKNLLDDALLRPGRFDRAIYMGRPSVSNRVKILQVHAAGKPMSHEGGDGYETEALLHQTAERTVGYSGAELAGLLNEAAILAVRHQKEVIDLPLIQEAIDKRELGLATARLPDTPAKRRLAIVEAARAVAMATTPGVPQLERLSIAPRGPILSRLSFANTEDDDGAVVGQLHRMYTGEITNAVQITEPLGDYELMCAMLLPLYAARAAEETFFGPRSVTMATAPDIAKAGGLAHYLVARSTLHPLQRDLPVTHELNLGGNSTAPMFERHTVRLTRTAYANAMKMCWEFREAIYAIARELLDNNDILDGARIVQLVKECQVDVITIEPHIDMEATSLSREHTGLSGTMTFSSMPGKGKVGLATFGGSLLELFPRFEDLEIDDEAIKDAAAVLLGQTHLQELSGQGFPLESASEVHEQLQREEVIARLRAIRRWSDTLDDDSEDVAFPPPPPDPPVFEGVSLESWLKAGRTNTVLKF